MVFCVEFDDLDLSNFNVYGWIKLNYEAAFGLLKK